MHRATCECCGEPLALPPAQPAPAQIEAREWNGHPIHRRQADGYVNASAVCQANRKRWNDYARLERTEAYIAALAADAGFPATGLVVSIKGGRPELQGTWIHPRLAVDLARWISPQFAVWMDGWFLEQFTTPLPTTTNRQPTVNRQGSPHIVIHAANVKAAESIWDRALTNAMVDRITTGRHFRGRILPMSESSHCYEVDFTA